MTCLFSDFKSLIPEYLFTEFFTLYDRFGSGRETPMHPSRTPMHPYQTPMRDPGGRLSNNFHLLFVYKLVKS